MERGEAQARLDRVRAFGGELDALEREGVLVLDRGQREAVRVYHDRLAADLSARFDVDRSDAQRQMSIGMRIASLVGAIALRAGVFLFSSRFWGWLPGVAQIATLAAAPTAALAVNEMAPRVDRSRHFLFIAALVACSAFVLDVLLSGRIFALADSPQALAAWA